VAALRETVRGGYGLASSDLEARVAELERVAADRGMASEFKFGMHSATADGAFRYQFYGWFANDWVWFTDEGDDDFEAAYGGSDLEGGTRFAHARIGASGLLYGNVRFKAEYMVNTADNGFSDVWTELANCSFGNVRVGHFKEPIGLDILTDDKFTTFRSRNAVSAMLPNRNTGLMLHGRCLDEAALYQVGVFRTTGTHGEDVLNDSTSGYNVTGRFSGRPLVADDGATWLHLGVGGSFRDLDDDPAGFTYDPAPGFAPPLLSASMPAEDAWILVGEAAFVAGPFCVKAEYGRYDVDGKLGPGDVPFEDATFDAWAVEASWWATGESNAYEPVAGSFGRVSPKRNFGDDGGTGAVQLAARFETIDTEDGDLRASPLNDQATHWTFGVNWWLNPNTRVTLDYDVVRHDDSHVDGYESMGVRFQVDF
jgi:phosphate-selective porin OprO/OprP